MDDVHKRLAELTAYVAKLERIIAMHVDITKLDQADAAIVEPIILTAAASDGGR